MNQEFKDVITDIKYRFRITQAEIADRLGVGRTYISEVINGRAPYNEVLRKKIEETFGYNKECDCDTKFVPLIPITARAGHLADFAESVSAYDCEKVLSPVKDAELAIPIVGESMYPEFPSGSIVFVKKINEKAFIEWGKPYVLDTSNGAVVKYLAPGSDGCVKCISANPDEMYAPFEIPLTEVYGIYRIVNMLCMK